MGSTHPHFEDRGLKWHTKLADALAEAKRDNKHVLIEYGREACSNCKKLVENVMPHPQIKAQLDKSFVLLAADCDNPEPEVRAIGAKNMSHARSLPFVMYLRAGPGRPRSARLCSRPLARRGRRRSPSLT